MYAPSENNSFLVEGKLWFAWFTIKLELSYWLPTQKNSFSKDQNNFSRPHTLMKASCLRKDKEIRGPHGTMNSNLASHPEALGSILGIFNFFNEIRCCQY